jgi:hypothetical protein
MKLCSSQNLFNMSSSTTVPGKSHWHTNAVTIENTRIEEDTLLANSRHGIGSSFASTTLLLTSSRHCRHESHLTVRRGQVHTFITASNVAGRCRSNTAHNRHSLYQINIWLYQSQQQWHICNILLSLFLLQRLVRACVRLAPNRSCPATSHSCKLTTLCSTCVHDHQNRTQFIVTIPIK